MRLRLAAPALLLAMLAGQSIAASFDCTKAGTYAEKEICRDGYLSSLDDWLSSSYRSAMEVNTDQADAVRQSQREWLLTRDACRDQKCLDKAISERINALDRYVNAEKSSAAAAQSEVQLARQQEAEASRQRQIDERIAAEERDRQTRAEADRQRAIIEQQRQAQQAQAEEVRRTAEHQQTLAQTPQYQPAHQVEQSTTAAHSSNQSAYASPKKSLWQQFKESPAWKYMLLIGSLLTAWAMWRHHQGQTTIYNDYTDAAITNLLPATGVFLGFLVKWLELPREVAMVTGLTGFLLALMFAIYASVRTNEGWLSVTLSLIAKVTLVSVFYAIIAILVASLFTNTKYKGESQARANARNRREKKETMAMIAALTTAYTFLSAWLCRRQEFTSVGECLEFDPAASAA